MSVVLVFFIVKIETLVPPPYAALSSLLGLISIVLISLAVIKRWIKLGERNA